MSETPQAALNAITAPAPLTLGKIALLERIQSPLLAGCVKDFEANLRAIWICRTPMADAARKIGKIEEEALILGDTLSMDEYNTAVMEVLEGIIRFYEMLPRPECGEDGEKKTVGSETGG